MANITSTPLDRLIEMSNVITELIYELEGLFIRMGGVERSMQELTREMLDEKTGLNDLEMEILERTGW